MKSDKTIAVNKRTGKTIQEMSWEEIRSLKGPRMSQKQLLEKFKSVDNHGVKDA